MRFLSSLKLTLFCLSWLFVLTFWGTIYQAQYGLYPAQQKFFTSLFFSIGPWLWLPGAKFTMGLLFINLLSCSVQIFRWKKNKLGILATHFGLFLFFISAWLTYTSSIESQATVAEGESICTAQTPHRWELAIWKNLSSDVNDVFAYDVNPHTLGMPIDLPNLGLSVTTHKFITSYTHLNESEKQASADTPIIIATVKSSNNTTSTVTLRANHTLPISQTDATQPNLYMTLRQSRQILPFTLTLNRFRQALHPNTEIAKSFESDILIDEGSGTRPVTIAMNKPLRTQDFTIYQASYGQNHLGQKTSTFAIVKNPNRILPYVASFITALGLFTHLLILVITRKKRNS